MSFAGSFQAIAARYGQTVTLWRDGEIVGTGRAVLRPLLGEARQFVPTDLGLRRQEMVLCLARQVFRWRNNRETGFCSRGRGSMGCGT